MKVNWKALNIGLMILGAVTALAQSLVGSKIQEEETKEAVKELKEKDSQE